MSPPWVVPACTRAVVQRAGRPAGGCACGPADGWRSGRELLEDLALGLDSEQQGHDPADQGNRGENGEDVADADVGDHEGDEDRAERGGRSQPGAAEAGADRAEPGGV